MEGNSVFKLKSQKQATKINFQPTKIFFTVYFHWTCMMLHRDIFIQLHTGY